jgi:hypothetical protein
MKNAQIAIEDTEARITLNKAHLEFLTGRMTGGTVTVRFGSGSERPLPVITHMLESEAEQAIRDDRVLLAKLREMQAIS